MENRQIRISLISDDELRLKNFLELLADPSNKISSGGFGQTLSSMLLEEHPDLLILDTVSVENFDYRQIEPYRSEKKLQNIPILFIVNKDDYHLLRQLYKNPHNRMLVDMVDKYLLASEIKNTLHVSRLERKVELYKNIVDGEKQLITYMDELLELSQLDSFPSKVELLNFIQINFTKRLELALAVEMCLFGLYDEKSSAITIRMFSDDGKEIKQKITIHLGTSKVATTLEKNYPLIFENDLLNDPFLQEMEESLGYKISGMMFIPIVLLQKPLGGIILLNKIYRDDFCENDLAFSTIAVQKIVFQLEKLEIANFTSNASVSQKLPLGSVASNSILLEKVLSAVDLGLVIFDAFYKIHYSNPAGLRTLRLNEQPIHLSKLVPPAAVRQIETNIEKGEFPVVRQELQMEHSSINDFFIGYSIYKMEWDMRTPYYILVFSEISQTKRIQAEIIRMDRMASLGMLSSGIAHEIRNPLAGIKAMAENMNEELEEDSSIREYTVRILRQVNRLDDLLRSFFKYAKPTRPDSKPCHIKTIVDEAIGLMQQKLLNQGIVVRENYHPDLYLVFVDANQIQQVLINMILNSMQAMTNGGQITISARNAETDTLAIDRRKRSTALLSDKFIEIILADSGIGFDVSTKEKIFNPFFTTKGTGTGLGLAIVYQIIREHGGQIDVESKVNIGTKFRILLPAITESMNSESEAALEESLEDSKKQHK